MQRHVRFVVGVEGSENRLAGQGPGKDEDGSAFCFGLQIRVYERYKH